MGPIAAGLVIGLGLGSGSADSAQAAEAPAAPVQANPERAAIVDLLDRSVTTGDVEAITAARDAAHRLLERAATETQRKPLRYLLAYANWRLLGTNPPPDGNERDALADEAESMLAANLAGSETDVEAQALLGAVYGMKIGSSMWRGMTLGRRAARAFDTARAIDERNPRFLLLKGLDVYHRPAMFGGGLERAEPWFRAAIGFFQAQPADAPWPIVQAERDALARDKALAEAELRVLQAQVEPHFLFNTLANVVSLIRTHPDRAARLLEQLTSLLRASLSRTRRADGTLGDELAVVRAYLDVQAFRMAGRMTFAVDVDPGLESVAVPPLLVQPLVENAVLHGIEPSPTGGHVAVRAERRGGGLRIRVADDGAGLDPDTAGHGVGIASVRERLRTAFGDRGRLTLTEATGSGVSADLQIPVAAPEDGRPD